MKFERHAFISYAHIDNELLATDKDGWVTRFHKVLAQMLAGRLGEKVNIWRDDALRPGIKFPAEIEDKLRDTAVLISVLSPRYLKSDWCRDELDHFCQIASEEGGLTIDNHCRVFKVVKLPLDKPDDDELPAAIHDTLPYEFYVVEDNTPIELDPSYGEQYGQKFLRRVASVATDIKQVIALLAAGADKPSSPVGPTVYLATTSSDRHDARDIIATELARLGCRVLPDHNLPDEEAPLIDDVRSMLARSDLSIHLIGDRRGVVPDGDSQRSAAEIQNELAVERCHAKPMARVIWVSSTVQPKQPEQTAFIQRLHTDAQAQLQADLITGDLETVKLAVRSALARIRQPQPPAAKAPDMRDAAPSPPAQRRVHVILDAADRRSSVAFLRALQARRARVSVPIFAGDPTAVREANQTLVLDCDEVWIYYGAGDEAWRFEQQREIERIRALRPDRVLAPEVLVLAGPDSDDKALLADLGLPGHTLVDLRAGFDPERQQLPD